MTLFVALDLETTGLDPDNDLVLEIAWMILDERFNRISPSRSFIVNHSDADWQEVWSLLKSNEVVRNMHEKSGLLNDLKVRSAMSTASLVLMLRDDIEQAKRESDETVHLTGFSIGFDRAFLQKDKNLGLLFDNDVLGVQFHHRLLDFSAVKLLWATAGLSVPEPVNLNKHRALDDVREVVDFAQALRGELIDAFEAVAL